MIPGLSVGAAPVLSTVLTPSVTSRTAEFFCDLDYLLIDGTDTESHAIGIEHVGGPELVVAVTDATRRIGAIRVETHSPGTLLFIDNREWRGALHANLRVLGPDCALIFNDIANGFVGLDVFLRSGRQVLYWGTGATAASCNIEMEGDELVAAIGDDALISNGVWLRNHGMHALHDLATGEMIGRPPVSTVVERHVWIGQDVLMLGCERIGMGSVVGARALVNGTLPACVVATGTPARVQREGISWGRDRGGMTAAERMALGLPATPAPLPAAGPGRRRRG